jgi:hypothetical protein
VLFRSDPRAQKADTLMPRLQLSASDIQTLVEYLTSLK